MLTSSSSIFKQLRIHMLCRQLYVSNDRSADKAVLHRHLGRRESHKIQVAHDPWCDDVRLTMWGCLVSSRTLIESRRMLRNLRGRERWLT